MDNSLEVKMRMRWPWWIVFAACFVWLMLKAPTLEAYLSNTDHGGQLCFGRQILQGKTPGIDLCMHYGALPGYTTALGLWLSGSLIGETVLCALGYAAAIALTGFLVSRYSSQLAGFVAAGFAYLLIARFYKWYAWLFPLLNLLALHGYLNAPATMSTWCPRRGRWALLTGGLLGVGWLFRWDLGTSGMLVSLLAIGLIGWQTQPRQRWQILGHQALVVAGFAVPLSIWFGYLAARGGWQAIPNYLAMLVDGSRGVVRSMAMDLPQFQRRALLAEPSLIIIAYFIVPATYVLCLLDSLWAEYRGRPTAGSRFLLLVALIGLSTLHQTLHRRGPNHLIQVIPPAIIGAHLFFCRFLESPLLSRPATWGRAVRFFSLSYFGFALIAGLGLMPWGRADLSAWEVWPKDRYDHLAAPLASGSQHPALGLVQEVQKRTTPEQSILIFPIECQYCGILNRRVSGIVFSYYPGLYDGSTWRRRNMAALEADPPALVAVRSDFLTPGAEIPGLVTDCRNAFPQVAQFIRERYTQVVYNKDGLILLGPAETASRPGALTR